MKQNNWRKLLPFTALPAFMIAVWIVQKNELDMGSMLLDEVLVVFGYFAAFKDIHTKQIPNRLIGGMLCAWVLILIPQLFLRTEYGIFILSNGIIGFLLGGSVFLIVYFVSKKGLGGGDVKLMAVSGLYLGFSKVLPSMLYGSVLAALAGGFLILTKKITKKDSIPLAPFLYAGMLLTIFKR